MSGKPSEEHMKVNDDALWSATGGNGADVLIGTVKSGTIRVRAADVYRLQMTCEAASTTSAGTSHPAHGWSFGDACLRRVYRGRFLALRLPPATPSWAVYADADHTQHLNGGQATDLVEAARAAVEVADRLVQLAEMTARGLKRTADTPRAGRLVLDETERAIARDRVQRDAGRDRCPTRLQWMFLSYAAGGLSTGTFRTKEAARVRGWVQHTADGYKITDAGRAALKRGDRRYVKP